MADARVRSSVSAALWWVLRAVVVVLAAVPATLLALAVHLPPEHCGLEEFRRRSPAPPTEDECADRPGAAWVPVQRACVDVDNDTGDTNDDGSGSDSGSDDDDGGVDTSPPATPTATDVLENDSGYRPFRFYKAGGSVALLIALIVALSVVVHAVALLAPWGTPPSTLVTLALVHAFAFGCAAAVPLLPAPRAGDGTPYSVNWTGSPNGARVGLAWWYGVAGASCIAGVALLLAAVSFHG